MLDVRVHHGALGLVLQMRELRDDERVRVGFEPLVRSIIGSVRLQPDLEGRRKPALSLG